MINDLRYGHEGPVAPDRVFTNGRFDEPIVLEVFFSFVAATVICVLLFCWFRFLDRGRREMV